MPVMTIQEFYTKQLFELEDEVYRPIYREFYKVLGEKTKQFMELEMYRTVAQLSCNGFVDILSLIRII